MEITHSKNDGITVIAIDGRLDGTTADSAYEYVNALLDNTGLILLDMSKCVFISSAGLRVLMVVGKSLAQQKGKGAMAKLLPEVMDVMEMTGFDHIFPCFDAIDEAVAHLKGN